MQQENFDEVMSIMEREATRVLDEAGRLSGHVTEQSAGWQAAQFGDDDSNNGQGRAMRQPSGLPPAYDGEGRPYPDLREWWATARFMADSEDFNVATRGTTTPRLSLAMESDDASDSELDLSVLAVARGGGRSFAQDPGSNPAEEALRLEQAAAMAYEAEGILHEQYEAEDTSIEGEGGEEVEEEEEEEEGDEEDAEVLLDPASMGLKEISNLGKFTVSSHKPGNGVQELRSDDLKLYWQYGLSILLR